MMMVKAVLVMMMMAMMTRMVVGVMVTSVMVVLWMALSMAEADCCAECAQSEMQSTHCEALRA